MRKEGKQLCYGRGMFHACLPIGYFGNQCSILTCLVWHFYIRHKQVIFFLQNIIETYRSRIFFSRCCWKKHNCATIIWVWCPVQELQLFKNFKICCMCWRQLYRKKTNPSRSCEPRLHLLLGSASKVEQHAHCHGLSCGWKVEPRVTVPLSSFGRGAEEFPATFSSARA